MHALYTLTVYRGSHCFEYFVCVQGLMVYSCLALELSLCVAAVLTFEGCWAVCPLLA